MRQAQNLKILLIQPYASRVGGVDSVLLHLIENLRHQGFTFVLVIPPGSPYVDYYSDLNIKVIQMDISVFSKVWTIPGILKPTILFVPSIFRLWRIFRQENIDLVHSHKINVLVGDIAAKLAKIPAVHTIHEVSTGGLWLYRFFSHLIRLTCHSIILVCEASGVLLSSNWRNWSHVYKIYNGVNLRRFDPNRREIYDLRQEFGIPIDATIVTAIGRIQKTKGFEHYIRAAAEILLQSPDTWFLLVGDVISDEGVFLKYKDELISLVNSLGIQDRFLFTGIRRDIEQVLLTTNIFVLPSVFDVLPTVVIEAMAMGKPVVATMVGGVPEIVVDGKTGYLVLPNNSRQLAQRILNLLSVPNLQFQMGMAGRERALEMFSSERYAMETAAVYRSALSSSQLNGSICTDEHGK